ncbi:hypothetical protein H7F50_05880 [Novosphingobium flavum]|uniref:Uncharacterized protein n=1 Tax=Novosphingobium aerophilum TaxID=2839843 RepID=A0A7X1F6E8_9SPHN|nr:hypothetical protein [Novosphingobium aerophilum]MBC2651256.1 hypothetical protein [Novosphingobium aerophilum]MBC2661278.1 hypothetical protein [Novosphingobium aerophilum]
MLQEVVDLLVAPDRDVVDLGLQLADRLIRTGALDPFSAGDDGKLRKASTASSYCWIVWIVGQTDTRYPGSPFDLPNYSDAAFVQADPLFNTTEAANNVRIHLSFEAGRPFIAALVGRAIARLRR